MKKILDNNLVRYGIVLAIGAAIGAIFYPTKNIEREIEAKYQSKIEILKKEQITINEKYAKEYSEKVVENKTLKQEASSKISSLTTENTQLKQQVKERTLKIIKPDGTIVEETFKESQTEVISKVVTDIKQEYTQKVTSIENKWKTVHEKRVRELKTKYELDLKKKQEELSEYKKKESIQTNPRNFGIAIGKMSNSDYYSNISYDVYGPFFIDFQFQSNPTLSNGMGGAGIGVRF